MVLTIAATVPMPFVSPVHAAEEMSVSLRRALMKTGNSYLVLLDLQLQTYRARIQHIWEQYPARTIKDNTFNQIEVTSMMEMTLQKGETLFTELRWHDH